jgi:hypothetical protein
MPDDGLQPPTAPLWPGASPEHPDEFESRDSFLLSLRLRFLLFLRRLGIRH